MTNQQAVKEVVAELAPQASEPLSKPELAIMTGFSRSGKSTYVRSSERLAGYFVISNDGIKQLLLERLPHITEGLIGSTPDHQLLCALMHRCRLELWKHAAQQGWAVVIDGCSVRKLDRQFWTKQAHASRYQAVVIWINPPKQVIIERVHREDAEGYAVARTTAGGNFEYQTRYYEEPQPGEADDLLEIREVVAWAA